MCYCVTADAEPLWPIRPGILVFLGAMLTPPRRIRSSVDTGRAGSALPLPQPRGAPAHVSRRAEPRTAL